MKKVSYKESMKCQDLFTFGNWHDVDNSNCHIVNPNTDKPSCQPKSPDTISENNVSPSRSAVPNPIGSKVSGRTLITWSTAYDAILQAAKEYAKPFMYKDIHERVCELLDGNIPESTVERYIRRLGQDDIRLLYKHARGVYTYNDPH